MYRTQRTSITFTNDVRYLSFRRRPRRIARRRVTRQTDFALQDSFPRFVKNGSRMRGLWNGTPLFPHSPPSFRVLLFEECIRRRPLSSQGQTTNRIIRYGVVATTVTEEHGTCWLVENREVYNAVFIPPRKTPVRLQRRFRRRMLIVPRPVRSSRGIVTEKLRGILQKNKKKT